MKRPRLRVLLPLSVRRNVPRPNRNKVVGFYGLIIDYYDWLLSRRGKLTPSRHLFVRTGVGGSITGFKASGVAIIHQLIELGGLKPGQSVLEVGCGIGRNAIPLTEFMNKRGRYHGIDIVPSSIGWCQSKISPEYPNFYFHLADVRNESYNPNGRIKASEYRFPFPNESFDLVFLISVFTHMIPPDFEHYLSEIARVLKPGARCLATFLLLNPESMNLLNSGVRDSDLKYDFGPYRAIELKNPREDAIAYREEYVEMPSPRPTLL